MSEGQEQTAEISGDPSGLKFAVDRSGVLQGEVFFSKDEFAVRVRVRCLSKQALMYTCCNSTLTLKKKEYLCGLTLLLLLRR